MNIDTIQEHFSIIQDCRQSAKVDYPLFDILFGSICAIIAGGQGWTDIREYVLGHHEWFLKQNLFEKGVPVDDTFARLIASIDPAEFRQCFLAWMKAVHKLTRGEVIAIDGKPYAARMTETTDKVLSIWSVPTPVPTNWYWAKLKRTRKVTKSLQYRHGLRCWTYVEPS